jgi:hypothetical protein
LRMVSRQFLLELLGGHEPGVSGARPVSGRSGPCAPTCCGRGPITRRSVESRQFHLELLGGHELGAGGARPVSGRSGPCAPTCCGRGPTARRIMESTRRRRVVWRVWREPSRGSVLDCRSPRPPRNFSQVMESGQDLPHCYELCQAVQGVRLPFFLFLKRGLRLCLCPFRRSPRFKTFSWHRQRSVPLLHLLSVHGPLAGTAPFDSSGHGQETSAPHLQSGLLPAPVRRRARAVSNRFGPPAS